MLAASVASLAFSNWLVKIGIAIATNTAIVASVNDHFDREYRIAADPYLETREKEDAFLKRVEEAVQRGLQASAPGNLNAILQLVQGAQPASPAPEAPPDEGTLDDALDFINNF